MNDRERDDAAPLGETTGGDTRRLDETQSDTIEDEGSAEEFTGGDTRSELP